MIQETGLAKEPRRGSSDAGTWTPKQSVKCQPPSDVLARLVSIKFKSQGFKLRLLVVLPKYFSESRVIKITMLIESRISTPQACREGCQSWVWLQGVSPPKSARV